MVKGDLKAAKSFETTQPDEFLANRISAGKRKFIKVW